jgi:NAD(P)H-flavin reductase
MKFKVGDKVQFREKVYRKPYTPYYDDYKGHAFEIVGVHEGDHIELKCITGDTIVKGHVHDDELIKIPKEGTVQCAACGEPVVVGNTCGRCRKPRWVVCAANRNKEGKIVCGARHWDNLMRGQILVNGKRPAEWLECEQGFVDQYGVFMDRQEAYTLAEKNGQIRHPLGHSEGTLFSENLY